MTDAPSPSPFARLDTALMRSTKSVAEPPVVQKPPPQLSESQKFAPERTNARTMQRSNGRRIITRNSFEIYEDQMDSLRKLAMKEIETTGKIGSMSAMVREAIDTYLLKNTAEK